MSTRDQILEALSESPTGLTLPQLAAFCTACEQDEQIVGNMIAILHREDVIHAGPERRDGLTVWIEVREPQEVHEAPMSLAGADQRTGSTASEAARAIANMRQGPKIAPKPATVTASKPVPAKPVSEGAALTLRAKIERCLLERGPMRSCDIARFVKEKYISETCSGLLKRKLLANLGGNKRGIIYGLPGQTPPNQKETTPVKGREPAPLSRRANGGGGAVTPAAGPAVASENKQAFPHRIDLLRDLLETPSPGDILYAAALLDLQERRGAVAEKLEKLDRAIEAMRALT